MLNGAGRFLAFLTDELKPWLRERYPVAVDDSMFFGDSRGGLFATYVLLTEPSTFRRYGIGSPSLYRDDGVKSMFDHEAEYAQTHDDLPAKVSFTVGGYENPTATSDASSSSPPTIEPGWKPTRATGRKTTLAIPSAW